MKYFQTAFEKWFRASGLKQFQAGIQLGISQSLVAKLLSGERGLSFAQADEIAKALNLTVIDMLMEGRRLCGEAPEAENLTAQQMEAIQAFKTLLLFGGELADEMTERIIAIARKKLAEANSPSPAKTKFYY